MAGRRGLLGVVLGLALPASLHAEEAPPAPRRRRPPTAHPAPPVAVAEPPRPPRAAIDRPAPEPPGPGAQPAPLPASNAQPPLVDRQPRPSITFGVPTPPLFGLGETFARPDSMSETRSQPGIRLPSPGATLRLPIW